MNIYRLKDINNTRNGFKKAFSVFHISFTMNIDQSKQINLNRNKLNATKKKKMFSKCPTF